MTRAKQCARKSSNKRPRDAADGNIKKSKKQKTGGQQPADAGAGPSNINKNDERQYVDPRKIPEVPFPQIIEEIRKVFRPSFEVKIDENKLAAALRPYRKNQNENQSAASASSSSSAVAEAPNVKSEPTTERGSGSKQAQPSPPAATATPSEEEQEEEEEEGSSPSLPLCTYKFGPEKRDHAILADFVGRWECIWYSPDQSEWKWTRPTDEYLEGPKYVEIRKEGGGLGNFRLKNYMIGELKEPELKSHSRWDRMRNIEVPPIGVIGYEYKTSPLEGLGDGEEGFTEFELRGDDGKQAMLTVSFGYSGCAEITEKYLLQKVEDPTPAKEEEHSDIDMIAVELEESSGDDEDRVKEERNLGLGFLSLEGAE